LQVNLFGSWRMIQAFLPPLKRSAHARIVNVSSGDGSYADPVSPLHSEAARQRGMESAKLLWSALTSTLAAELAATPVIVNAVCPGLTRPTQVQPAAGARPVVQSAAGLVWAATLPGDSRAVGSSAMDSLWTAAARDALKHRHGASIRWPHHESIA
jgi:NAD(P)-dependent dehydrogenase (short-subunit alcohol dehydrogenase family)